MLTALPEAILALQSSAIVLASITSGTVWQAAEGRSSWLPPSEVQLECPITPFEITE